jgi:hypothetical protein
MMLSYYYYFVKEHVNFSVRSGCMPIVLWMGHRDVHFPTGFDYITRNGRNIKRIERIDPLDGQF